MDGALNLKESGAKIILTNPDGVIMEYALGFNFNTTNKGAKCDALIVHLKIAKELKIKEVKDFSNSQLVVQ